jgi:DNA mismatch repair protein MutL
MARIRILSDQVANQIAAGEVVERPASVVKELLENSLDAGATDLRIEVEAGGRRLIRIADNGCGMLRDDALLAFERHATSKLSAVKDLLSISTLGFRGEALPSIASVSRLVLETRSAQESTGTRVEIAGGKILNCTETALASGTVIAVRDLFYNVPARRKFLRSEQTELAHIASLVTHYSLIHPDKTFLLRHETNELLNVTPVATLRERVYQVFGGQVLDDLIDLGLREKTLTLPPPYCPPGSSEPPAEPLSRTFRLSGFLSRPQVQKANRNSIYLIVNRRLIRDRLLLHALSAAYHNLMPAGCYPFALLFLDCDYEEVDVNVHPSKTEVRFRHGPVVHDFVRDSLREALMETRPVSTVPLSFSPQPAAGLPYSEFTQRIENLRFDQAWIPPAAVPDTELPEIAFHIPPQTARLPIPASHAALPPDAAMEPAATLSALADLRPIGQLHSSFIIAAGRDGLWIVDQHVAHERILFEQILRQEAGGRLEVQRLLMPLVIDLSPAQQIEYARIADELHRMGFETEPFGLRTIAVKAAPAALPAAEIDKLLFDVLETAENELRGVSVEELRKGIAASVACRAAIKINTPLDQKKMEWLLASLAATDYPMSCPHGRPIALRYSTRDILKGFHRI